MITPFRVIDKTENLQFKDVPLYKFFRFRDSHEILIKVSFVHRMLHNGLLTPPRCSGVPCNNYDSDTFTCVLSLNPTEWVVYALDNTDNDAHKINWNAMPVVLLDSQNVKMISPGDYQ